ncbi:MAG TPA: hypothetical protein VFN48_01180 [Solirubrobacteraceae bacterium]|nr:hypothetical protein [Solirubrobacteraceae bacterium]
MSQRKRKSRASQPATRTASRDATPSTSATRAAAAQTTSARPAAAPSRPPASSRSGRRQAPAPDWVSRYSARAEQKNAEARANLVPLAAGQHPLPLAIAIGLALIFSLGTLVLMVAGVKVGGRPPATSWILYVVVMFACAVGMYKHWFQAVLAFMCLLAIALIILCALLVRASNLLGLLLPLVLISGGGTLFWKLVRVLARIQMPERPTRPAA